MIVVSYNAIVKHENGLHATNSAKLVQDLSKFNGEFQLIRNGSHFDMKSILGLMSLALYEKTPVQIRVALYDNSKLLEAINVISEHFELSDETELLS